MHNWYSNSRPLGEVHSAIQTETKCHFQTCSREHQQPYLYFSVAIKQNQVKEALHKQSRQQQHIPS